MKKVGIIMGSDSDLPVVKAAVAELKRFDVGFALRCSYFYRLHYSLSSVLYDMLCNKDKRSVLRSFNCLDFARSNNSKF